MNLVWYVAYGSNLLKSRFMKYIDGDPNGNSEIKRRGCEDKTPPETSVRTTVPYGLYYGNSSSNWGGCGAAFLDTSKSANTPARAWLVKNGQFDTIRELEGTAATWYGRQIELGTICGIRAVTFTYKEKPFPNEPSEAYKAVMADGLREMESLDFCKITNHTAHITKAVNASRTEHSALKQNYPDSIILLDAGNAVRTYDVDAEKVADLLGVPVYKNAKGEPGLCISNPDIAALETFLEKAGADFVIFGKNGIVYQSQYDTCSSFDTDNITVCSGMYIEVLVNGKETERWYYGKNGENIKRVSVGADGYVIFTDVPITELNGYSVVTPNAALATAINGKHIGDGFECNGVSYRITNVSTYEFEQKQQH